MASRRGILLAAAVLACAVASGCGSDAERSAPPPPKLPFETAQRLATESDSVATALAAGDPCGALDAAERLRVDAIEAINMGRVPAAFREELLSAVNDLPSRIECIREEDEDDGRGRGEDKDKDKGKGKDKDKDKDKRKDGGKEDD